MTAALDTMHKQDAEHSDAKQQTAINAHNRKTNKRPINFMKAT